jgi:hypothetical protein
MRNKKINHRERRVRYSKGQENNPVVSDSLSSASFAISAVKNKKFNPLARSRKQGEFESNLYRT